jgi:hypothetical protein
MISGRIITIGGGYLVDQIDGMIKLAATARRSGYSNTALVEHIPES